MIRLSLPGENSKPFVVLCLGAHSDDIEIGCGGAVLHLAKTVPQLRFHWVVFSASGPRAEEAAKGAELFTAGCEKQVVLNEYRDGFLPFQGAEVKEFFEDLKSRVNPDLIFTHWRDDAHQDHRLVSQLTWNTFRDHLILEYEVPKYDGDVGRPNTFVALEAADYERKVDYLLQAFRSQSTKRWFDRETFLAMMRIRGMESNAPSGYAEAFHARKVLIGSRF